MNKKLIRLAERREHLVTQAAAQRAALSQCLTPWRAPLVLADHGLAAVRYLKSHPALVVGAAVFLVVLRPSRVGKWLRGGLVMWQVARTLRTLAVFCAEGT